MDEFLIDLYALTKGAARTPREDFLSLCLGNALRRDRELAAEVLRMAVSERTGNGVRRDRVGTREERVRRWLMPPEPDASRALEVQSQVAARSGAHEHVGWVDLRLLLSGADDEGQGVIFEAKVGQSAPSKAQLARYASAQAGDLIVALVQENARKLCEHHVPVVTWDEIATALSMPSGADHHDVERRQLLALLAHATVIDPRRGLPATSWSRAVRAYEIYGKFRPRLEKMLVELGPNQTIRQMLAADVEEQRGKTWASHGWGPGVCRSTPYPGSFLSGVTISVDAGDHPNELVWYLEVYPSREPIRARMRGREFSAWWPSKGSRDWFTTRLPRVSRGRGRLTKADLAEVVRLGREALRSLHNGTPGVAWPAHGPGNVPNAGQDKSIPELRAGLRDYDAVHRALRGACCQIVAAIASPGQAVADADVKRKGAGWVTDAGPRRIWAGVTPDLKRIRVCVLGGAASARDGLAAGIAGANEDGHRFGMTVEDIDEGRGVRGPAVVVGLTPENWQAPELTHVLARLLAAG
jgi:hypothetical protein